MTLRSLAFSVAVLAAVPAAEGADMDALLAAPEIVLTQTTSGAYLRADLFYDFTSDLDGTQVLGGPGGVFAAPLAHAELGDAPAFGLGLGYRFTDMLRADLTLRYAESDLDAGPSFLPGCGAVCFASAGADVENWEVLANAYVDLGTIAGFTPYVGGGLGAVHARFDDPFLSACAPSGCSGVEGSGSEDWRFAYALSAGVAYDFTDALALDVGYRYLGTEEGDAYRFDARPTGLAGVGLVSSDDGFDTHSIRVGLRYRLW